jgi:hypothetical protein
MEQITELLTLSAKQVTLETRFNYPIPEKVIFDLSIKGDNNYEKNVDLKEKLSTLMLDDKINDISYWIIQKWGGIQSFRKTEKNDKLIPKFLSEIQKGKLSKSSFSTISSLSKIASFMNPNEYFIYDSRVIFSLNWLLYCSGNRDSLFIQPNSRNTELNKYDLGTIMGLAKNEVNYIDYSICYHKYCDFIKTYSKSVYPNKKSYCLEMLLFTIADNEIINDIKDKVKITIEI